MAVEIQSMDIEKASLLLKLLGDKTRLKMVKLLETDDFCVCEFVEIFGISQPAISQHIRKLKDAGMVTESRKGQWIFYSLNQSGECAELMMALLKFLPDQQGIAAELEKKGKRIHCGK
ncbi:ArsR/SmtB family transcription factor [Planococcus dechangensis]|uniref:ArsR/SmtB family transcription factor n=1 Tax=Planococcus dechangensis TaxID=1176255 RepID=A0ABV9M6M2_9BACL